MGVLNAQHGTLCLGDQIELQCQLLYLFDFEKCIIAGLQVLRYEVLPTHNADTLSAVGMDNVCF